MNTRARIDMEDLVRRAARRVEGLPPIEAMEVLELEDWTNEPSYYFTLLVEQDPQEWPKRTGA